MYDDKLLKIVQNTSAKDLLQQLIDIDRHGSIIDRIALHKIIFDEYGTQLKDV